MKIEELEEFAAKVRGKKPKLAQSVCRVHNAVATLAKFKSADKIADFLEAQEISGITGAADSCPIARYVRKTTGIRQVTVDGETVVVSKAIFKKAEELLGDEDGELSVDATPAMEKFVERFDEGLYPNLKQER